MASNLSEDQRKTIETIVWRLRVAVVKQMKEIPARELFGWKEDKE
jgi:hypothetical protein